MRSIALLFAVMTLTACAGRDQLIEQGTTGLVGQPLSAAVAKLGVPTEERTIADMKVYVWSTGTVSEGTQATCQIRAIMRGDVIGSFDWEGNEGQCSHYALMLQTPPSDCKKGIMDTRVWLLPCP
jgi:hypothetical protein